MKFQVKALVAALALAGAVGQASAANSTSDLIFYAWDNATSVSYMYDLGSSFNANTSSIGTALAGVDVTTGSDWTTFTSAVGSNWASTVQWGVAMNLTTTSVGSTIHLGGGSTASNPTSANNQINLLVSAAGLTSAGATHFGTGAGYDNVLTSFVKGGQSTYGGNLWDAGNLVGASNVTWKSAAPGTRGSVLYTSYTPSNGNGFAFNGDTLSYNVAAVPEPESYAMLVAGLLMLGTVARRRLG